MTNLTIAFFLKFRFWDGDESEKRERRARVRAFRRFQIPARPHIPKSFIILIVLGFSLNLSHGKHHSKKIFR